MNAPEGRARPHVVRGWRTRSGHPRLGVNLRRDAHLPLLLLIGAIAVAPLRMRSKAICLPLGTPIVLAASLAALATLVAWVFAGGLGPPDAMNSHALDVAVRMLLAPPGDGSSRRWCWPRS